MKINRKLVFLILATFLWAVQMANAQWQKVTGSGIYSGLSSINCLLISGDSIIAGTGSGIYLSSNDLVSWSTLNSGLIGSSIITLFENQGRIFTSTAGGGYGIFNGTYWDNYMVSGMYGSFQVMTANGSNLFAGTNAGGVLLSTNNGTSWEKKYTGLPYSSTVNSIVALDTIVYAVANGSSYYSSDTANNWHAYVATGNRSISAFFLENNVIYGNTYGSRLRSGDNGKSWQKIEIGESNNSAIGAMASKGTNIFAGVLYRGVYVSIDNGLNWKLGYGLPNNIEFRSLKIKGDVIYAGTSLGLYYAPLKTIIPPKAPSSLVVADSLNQTLTLKWKKNSETDFLHYRIYVGTSPSTLAIYDSTVMGKTDTAKTITGLNNRTKYYIQVTAVDSFYCESPYSNVVSATIKDTHAPTAPNGLVITDDSFGNFTIKWKKNSETDILRYRIYMGLSADNLKLVDSTSTNVNDTTNIFNHLWADHMYYLAISAVDLSVNESPLSNIISDTASHIINLTTDKSHVFGNTKLGENREEGIYYKFTSNAYSDTLRIKSVVSTKSDFIILDSTAVVTGQYSSNYLNIRFAPTQIGPVEADIIVTSNAITKVDTVHVSGYGYGEGKLLVNKIVELGRVLLNETIDTLINLQNIGNDTLKIQSINYDNEARIIPPGESIKDTFHIEIAQLGTIIEKFIFYINWNPIDTVTLNAYGYGIPELEFESPNLDLGILKLDEAYTNNFYLSNIGTDTLKINKISSANSLFEISDTSIEIPPKDGHNIQIMGTPKKIGYYSDSIFITSNDSGIKDTVFVSAIVKGIPVIESSLSQIDFGEVKIGTHTDSTFILTNTGTDTLFIDRFETNASEFEVLEGVMSLAPGVWNSYTIRYAPINGTKWYTALTVVSNTTNNYDIIISLSGQGVDEIIGIQQLNETNWNKCYPNPFINTINFNYYLASKSNVKIIVYDLSGKGIVTLEDSKKFDGLHQLVWNGKNSEGISVDPGIYLLKVVVYDSGGNKSQFKANTILLMKQ